MTINCNLSYGELLEELQKNIGERLYIDAIEEKQVHIGLNLRRLVDTLIEDGYELFEAREIIQKIDIERDYNAQCRISDDGIGSWITISLNDGTRVRWEL
ncbi:MAG: hypothetical protein Q8M92_01235 [Candidatus Subteraquimicrobiales bacterium]|nr:hypothetical protein [Candidatus Subteraquimicrobiales bacterium]